MDRIDYTFKFSTELVVVGLSLFIIGVNFAGAKALNSFNGSLFSKLLSYHQDRNPLLYTKTTSVKTVVAEDNGSPINPIKVALASDNFNSDTTDTTTGDPIIDNNTIVRQNPVTVDKLIADQIKVYQTQQGDTLQSISAKYGISVDTIKWANNLNSDTIKPGWDLVILPVSGVVHTVTNNDTLPDIAKKYNVDINQIISFNGLADDSDTQPGQLLIIPGGTITPPPTPKPQPQKVIKDVVKGKVVYEPIPSGVQDFGGSDHIFPYGQCTYWASKLRGGVPWGGNANQWLANARAYGAKEGNAPMVGAIVVTSESRRYGHVAIVKQVDAGRFLVSEMNYKGRGVVDERWIDSSSSVIRGFIY